MHSSRMRLFTFTGFAALIASAVLAALPASAGASGRLQHDRGPSPSDRIQHALDACHDRGAAEGSDQQRRCAERLLGLADGALIGSVPSNSDSGERRGGGGSKGGGGSDSPAQPPAATTTTPAPAPTTTTPAPPRATSTPAPPRATSTPLPPRTSSTPAPAPTTTMPAPAPAPAPPPARAAIVSDQGIVQAASSDAVVLRTLDGASLTIPYDRRTVFTLSNRATGRNVVQPGAVAVVRHYDGGVAVEVRVVPVPKPKFRTDRAIIDTATRTVLVVRLTNGSGLPLAIDGATRVYLPNGRRGGPELLQAGYLVDVVYDPAGAVPVQSVRIIRRVS